MDPVEQLGNGSRNPPKYNFVDLDVQYPHLKGATLLARAQGPKGSEEVFGVPHVIIFYWAPFSVCLLL
jgi:hypothetical protein